MSKPQKKYGNRLVSTIEKLNIYRLIIKSVTEVSSLSRPHARRPWSAGFFKGSITPKMYACENRMAQNTIHSGFKVFGSNKI